MSDGPGADVGATPLADAPSADVGATPPADAPSADVGATPPAVASSETHSGAVNDAGTESIKPSMASADAEVITKESMTAIDDATSVGSNSCAAPVIPAVASDAAAAPPLAPQTEDGTSPVQHFVIADDDDEEEVYAARNSDPASAAVPTSSSSNSAPRRAAAEAGLSTGDMAFQIREKLRFLSPDDQKTVCRRESQIAQKREAALLNQIVATMDRYAHALEVAKVVETGAMLAGDPANISIELEQARQDEGPVLTQELARKCEDRVRLLRGTLAALAAEPPVVLPKLTVAELAKASVFAGYATTAEAASRFVAAPAIGGARMVLSSFANRFRRANSATDGLGSTDATPSAADSGGYRGDSVQSAIAHDARVDRRSDGDGLGLDGAAASGRGSSSSSSGINGPDRFSTEPPVGAGS
eukprot:TRINITY_DN4942_c0_g1_i2.p1 TRINITY_DN4942_c0_g1~~TRINITY_DN4942_c0_g1_i2.p1  ORF type:complete len:416 (+),score=90.00 TRINITY_DN4942_c0_g1_i2:64-1311(+)